tara:strand:- start:1 stop:405 length:405 start_codon:yes stop_codon:yes gene_type:complete
MPLISEIPITDEYAALIGNPLSLIGKAALLPLIVRGVRGSKAFRQAAKRFAKAAQKVDSEFSKAGSEELTEMGKRASIGKHLGGLPLQKGSSNAAYRKSLLKQYEESGLSDLVDTKKESERVMEGVKNLFGGLK